MENQFQLANNGQSVLKADLDGLGETSGLADDRVLAELFRLTPYDGATVARGILPYGSSATASVGTIVPNGASGTVLVEPFRAVVGSRTAVATDAKKNWRDIRSAIGIGTTTLAQTISLAANASGNPRWDLLYAAVSVDGNNASVLRKVKDPTTKVITEQSVVTTLATTVAIGVVAGTPAASPDWPAVPADAGSTYYIVLGYVRVPNGFSAASTVLPTDIADQAPVVSLSHVTGASSLQIANGQYTVGGAQLSAAMVQAWGASGTRPRIYLPPSTSGGDELLVAVDLSTGNTSIATGGVVDSRDWRNRICKWTAGIGVAYSAGTVDFVWKAPSLLALPGSLSEKNTSQAAGSQGAVHGVGATLLNGFIVAYLFGDNVPVMPNGSIVYLFVDHADGGKLKITYSGAPNCQLLFWIQFTAPWGNAG